MVLITNVAVVSIIQVQGEEDNKMNIDKKSLKEDYETSCYNYLIALLDAWGYDAEKTSINGWWVGDDIGGVFCLNDNTFINMEEIIYCVDNDIDEETYDDYCNYNLKCAEYGFNQMNLKSFINGAPRIDNETFSRLGEMKQQLNCEIEKIKEES